jgi:Fe2+ transport system protein FeoA
MKDPGRFNRELGIIVATQSQLLLASRTPMFASKSTPLLTLARAKCGERLRVTQICPDCPECVRLRELGFYDSAEVRKISDGAAIICVLLGMRVAIGRDLGEHVHVEKIAA